MTDIGPSHEEHLYTRVVGILEDARSRVSRTVNTAMVHSYWLIGREIVQVEQRGRKRAEYGQQLMRRLAERLATRFGRGFGVPTLRNMRQFYLTYPAGTALPENLGVHLSSRNHRVFPGDPQFAQQCLANLSHLVGGPFHRRSAGHTTCV